MQACDFTARVARAAVLHTLCACVSCKAACSAAAVETSADQLIVVSCRWHQLACSASSACMQLHAQSPAPAMPLWYDLSLYRVAQDVRLGITCSFLKEGRQTCTCRYL